MERTPPAPPVDFARPLTDYSRPELAALLADLGQPAYRARQLWSGIYRQLAQDYDQLTNLPKALRAQLAERAPVTVLRPSQSRTSRDGLTTKLLFVSEDGAGIEAVSIKEGDRHTVCISSQVGCAMGCIFCATGMGGLGRQLLGGEIVEQVLAVQRLHGTVTNVVFMGMGEPLANYKALRHAIRTLHDPDGLGLSARRMIVSTVGVVRGIDCLADEGLPIELAISLHATDDATRRRIVPSARRWSLREILAAAGRYAAKSGRMVTYEYVLLAGINDSPEHAGRLARIARGQDPDQARQAGPAGQRAKVNLIPWNPVPDIKLEEPTRQAVRQFRDILERAGVAVTIRKEKGRDVDAACGQLRRPEQSPQP